MEKTAPNKHFGSKKALNIPQTLEKLKGVEIKASEFKNLSKIIDGTNFELIQAQHIGKDVLCTLKQYKEHNFEENGAKYFCREAKILSKCRNFFLIPFYGVSLHSPYLIATKYFKNGTLFNIMRVSKLSATNKTIIAFGIASGMKYIHDHGLVHKDLRSSNVFIDDELFPHVFGFDVSCLDKESIDLMTKNGEPTSWIAPEAYTSKNYTNKVDVYSFGFLLWEMLTEDDIPLKLKKEERPKIPKDCQSALKQLIESCWDQNPSKRPSFSDIIETIRNKKAVYSGTDEKKLSKFFDLYDSFIFEKKGKQSSPLFTKKTQQQRKASTKEDNDLVEIEDADIPNFKVSEVDVSSLNRFKKDKIRRKSSFDFDEIPEAVPEPESWSLLKPQKLLESDEVELDPATKKSLINQSKMYKSGGAKFKSTAFIQSFHPELESDSEEGEEEEEEERRKKNIQNKNISKLFIPPSLSEEELYNQPLQLIIPTTLSEVPNPSDLPKSPFLDKIKPENPLPDPSEYHYEVKPIPKPTVFIEPTPPEYDENNKKINPFLLMEAPESRGRTVFGSTNADVLLDYEKPTFESTFIRTESQLNRNNARDFFSCISVLFTPPVPLYISKMVLQHCLECLDMNQNAWRPFATSEAALSLPFSTPCLFDLSAKIFLYLIPMNPSIMTVETARQILSMCHLKMQQVLRIFSVYAANIKFIADPMPVLNQLIDASLFIIDNGGAVGLIRILFNVIMKDDDFHNEFGERCLNIFAHSIYTVNFNTAAVAFSAICDMENVSLDLPNDILVYHLKYQEISPFVISYLARKETVPVDEDIIKGILKASVTNEAAAMLLCKVAEDEKGAETLSRNTSWMDDGHLALNNSVRIFTLIFKFKELQSPLIDSINFETFINRLVMSSDDRYLAAASFILAKVQLSFAIIERLRSKNLFSRFMTVAANSKDASVVKGMTKAIIKISEVEYCSEMNVFIQNWKNYLEINVDDALSVAVSLTEYQEAIDEFKKLDIVSVIEKLSVCKESESNRDLFLSRISSE